MGLLIAALHQSTQCSCVACTQVMDGEMRGKFPHAVRLVQTVLWHPKAVAVLRTRLQPAARAHEYTEGAANAWGEGPFPLEPMAWNYTIPWTGQCTCSRISITTVLPPTLAYASQVLACL